MGLIDKLKELDNIIAKFRYVQTGDLILADDHNKQNDAIMKIRDTLYDVNNELKYAYKIKRPEIVRLYDLALVHNRIFSYFITMSPLGFDDFPIFTRQLRTFDVIESVSIVPDNIKNYAKSHPISISHANFSFDGNVLTELTALRIPEARAETTFESLIHVGVTNGNNLFVIDLGIDHIGNLVLLYGKEYETRSKVINIDYSDWFIFYYWLESPMWGTQNIIEIEVIIFDKNGNIIFSDIYEYTGTYEEIAHIYLGDLHIKSTSTSYIESERDYTFLYWT